MIIDTHAHLTEKDFEGDLPDVLRRAREKGVGKIVNIGFDVESCRAVSKMAEEYEECYAALAVSPYDTEQLNDEVFEEWEKMISKNDKIVAIGECGLDYYKVKTPAEQQKHAFRVQILFAQKMGLPLIIHNREADLDCIEILREVNSINNPNRVKVVFHSFGSSLDFAKEVWMEGYYTSFSGIVTFPSAKNLVEVAREVPFDRFLIETDCPYLAPQGNRGKRNEPSFVLEVAEKLAEIRGVDVEKIKEYSLDNSLVFFDRI